MKCGKNASYKANYHFPVPDGDNNPARFRSPPRQMAFEKMRARGQGEETLSRQ